MKEASDNMLKPALASVMGFTMAHAQAHFDVAMVQAQ